MKAGSENAGHLLLDFFEDGRQVSFDGWQDWEGWQFSCDGLQVCEGRQAWAGRQIPCG